MSATFQSLVFPQVDAGDAERLGTRLLDHLRSRGVLVQRGHDYGWGPTAARAAGLEGKDVRPPRGERVELITRRTVFDTRGAGTAMTCAHCDAEAIDPDLDACGAAALAWLEGDDDAVFACPVCDVPSRLTDWDGPLSWAFGHLGLTFWHWPELSAGFVKELEGVVGSRVKVVYGRT